MRGWAGGGDTGAAGWDQSADVVIAGLLHDVLDGVPPYPADATTQKGCPAGSA